MTVEQALVRLYQQAAKRLRVQIRRSIASGQLGSAAYQAAQLRAVSRELAALGQRTRPLATALALDSYLQGGQLVDFAGGRGRVGFEFAGAHRQAAEVYARNLTGRLASSRELVGRRTRDAFRTVSLEETAIGTLAGQARREVSKSIEQRLLREGVTDALTGFVDARGARWQLDNYAAMVARTTTREAMSAATQNRMEELGELLVAISEHAGACEICIPYQGKTWALPGHDVAGYRTIDRLPPFHPNCRHVAAPAAANFEAIEREFGLVA